MEVRIYFVKKGHSFIIFNVTLLYFFRLLIRKINSNIRKKKMFTSIYTRIFPCVSEPIMERFLAGGILVSVWNILVVCGWWFSIIM